MKIKNLFLLAISCLLLSSCFVKSLHPFYTSKTIAFDTRFIGEWEDEKKGIWTVIPFKEKFLEEEKTPLEEMSQESQIIYEKYKEGYYVNYKKNGKESDYLVIPFQLKNQLFLDFTPLFVDSNDLSSLTQNHLIPTHSLVKFDVLKNNSISMKWLDESRLTELFKNNKIKIKHEKTGIADDGILLTASSEELQKFIKKYMSSNDDEKWSTDTNFTLTKADVKP